METEVTFKDLGLIPELCDSCERVGWKTPTNIQREAIPVALKGRDVIGLAETGSGKTGAFGLPLLQALLLQPQRCYGLILTPTRELAVQIKEQLDDLGQPFGLSCCAVVGGIDMTQQAAMLLKKPHVIVATLGRLVDHMKHLKGFSLSTFKYLVMDEADRILTQDFEAEVDRVVRALPTQRTTMLFSATITNQVRELQRAHLKDAVKIEINSSFKTVDALKQYFIAMPFVDRHVYLLYLLRELNQNSVMVFCNTRRHTMKTALVLRHCGHKVIPLYGDMTQTKRLEALAKFREQERSVLVATNVASRGLDLLCVDYVINLEVPTKSEDYIHRVGRTARAGRSGVAITFVSQFELESFLRIEQLVMQGQKMSLYKTIKAEVDKYSSKVAAGEKFAKQEIRRIEEIKRENKERRSDDEDEDGAKGGAKRRKGAGGPRLKDRKQNAKKFKK